MKTKIAWALLLAMALIAVPVSHASVVPRADSSFDGTQPPIPPLPVPGL